MKNRILSLLIIAVLCCSALCLFAGCEGVEGDYALVYDSTADITFTLDENFSEKSETEIRTLLTSKITGKFIYTGNTEGVTLNQILTGGGSVNGFDLSRAGNFSLRITYQGYTCSLAYTVA